MRESAVRIRHAVRILALLHRSPTVVRRVHQLPRQPLNHRIFTPCPRRRNYPADRQSLAALDAHLDRNLVGGAAHAPRPNILFMMADDWGWNHAGAYGCQWVKTPTFDRIAREGMLFNNCFTSNPKCSPCRASILTGRNTWQLEEAVCHFGLFPAKFAVYPDLLEEAGYHVGFTGKGWGPGDWKNGGFRRNPAGTPYQRHRLKPLLKAVSNQDLPKNFADFLKDRKPGQPFCFWIGTHEPHRAYEIDSGLRAGKRPADVVVPAYLPDNDVVRRDLVARIVRAYDGAENAPSRHQGVIEREKQNNE